MLLNHSLDHLWTPLELVDLAHDLEQLHKVLDRRVLDLDLVRDTTQERIVDQIFRFEVSREYD